MATISSSKTTTINGAGSFILKAEFSSNQDENSSINNTSKVTAKATLSGNTGGFAFGSTQGTLKIYFHDNKSDSDVLVNSLNIGTCNKGESKSVSGTINVKHKDDGTLSGYAKAVWTKTGSSNYVPSSGSISTDTKTFNTIDVSDMLTLSNDEVELGKSVTITVNREIPYTYKLSYIVNDEEKYITFLWLTEDNTTFVPELSIANKFPNSDNGLIYIKCYQYRQTSSSDRTLISTKTKSLKVLIPSSIKPSISATLLEANPIMLEKNWGVFVKGKTQLRGNISALGDYNSTIKNYNVDNIEGKKYNTSQFTSDILNTVGTKEVNISVTDSRNRTASLKKSYTVLDYEDPKIEVAECQRCMSDGTVSNEGTYLKYSFKASISSVDNKNNIQKYEIGYKEKSASTYTYKIISNSGYSLDKKNIILSGVTLSNIKQYDIVFKVSDSFNNPTTIIKSLGTIDDLMNFNASGKSMAIGKISEATVNETKLEVALDTEFVKPVKIGNKNVSTYAMENNKAQLYNNGTKVYPVVDIKYNNKTLEQILDSLFFQKGETFTASDMISSGFLTSSNKDVYFNIVLPKRLDNISTITVVKLEARARCNNSYILGSGSAFKDIKNATIEKVSENQLTIFYSSSTSLGGTNNSAIGVMFNISLKFN